MYVDGFDRFTNKVYEFLGFYHRCPMTFPITRCVIASRNNTLQEVYQRTIERLKAIEEAGYVVKVILEDQWNQFKKEKRR